MADHDDLESFRGSLAHLDPEAEQRIRRRFEALRDRGAAASPTFGAEGDAPDDERAHVVELTPTAAPVGVAPRHSRRVQMGVAAAVVLLALVGIATLLRTTTDDTADVASGVDVPLSEIASLAAGRADQDLTPEQYLYRAATEGATYAQVDRLAGGHGTEQSEWWLRRDGTGMNSVNESRWESTTDGVGQMPNTTDPRVVRFDVPQTFYNPSLSYDQLRALPTDPAALLDQVHADSGGDPGDASLDAQTLAWWLAIDTVPPDVRAAAFNALALIGAEPNGRMTTPSGREGVGYQGTGADGKPWVVVIDPTTTRLMAFARGAGSGDQLWTDAAKFYEYDEQAIVASLPS